MKKILVLSILALCACGKHADSSQVHLEDGKPGLMVRCNGLDDDQCVQDVCKNGGKILHRNVANQADTVLISCQK
jgi:hypothetical protein